MSKKNEMPQDSNAPRGTITPGESIPSARQYIEYVLKSKKDFSLPKIPPVCIISYTDALIALACNSYPHLSVDLGCTNPTHLHFFMPGNENSFAIARGHHGAPMAAVLLEELIALGFQKFLVVGAAGHPAKKNAPTLGVGDLVLAGQALIFEGTSPHYYPGHRSSAPDTATLAAVRQALLTLDIPFHQGPAATTDALYRETHDFIDALADRQVLALDMELSAFFTVAAYHRRSLAGLLFISDVVESGGAWHLGFLGKKFVTLQTTLFQVIQKFIATP